MLRTLLILVLVAAAGWAGYWWLGATAKKAAIEGWMAEQQERGRIADAAALRVTGFPNRFDTVIRDLTLADPRAGWAWTAPEFRIMALSYRPNHVIASWPATQTLALTGQRIEVTGRRLLGSLRFAPDTRMALRQAMVEAEGALLRSSDGWHMTLADAQIAMREDPAPDAPEFGYELSLTMDTLGLPAPLYTMLSPDGLLPGTLAEADFRLTPVFTTPLDRLTVESGAPRLAELGIEQGRIVWGHMRVTASGRLTADAAGLAEGTLKIEAENWADMLPIAVRAELIGRDQADTLRSALGFLARMTGDADRLSATLTFVNGVAMLGPVPLGPAPRLN